MLLIHSLQKHYLSRIYIFFFEDLCITQNFRILRQYASSVAFTSEFYMTTRSVLVVGNGKVKVKLSPCFN